MAGTKISITLPEDTLQTLETLAHIKKQTRSEAFIDVVALAQRILNEKALGSDVYVRNNDGDYRSINFLQAPRNGGPTSRLKATALPTRAVRSDSRYSNASVAFDDYVRSTSDPFPMPEIQEIEEDSSPT